MEQPVGWAPLEPRRVGRPRGSHGLRWLPGTRWPHAAWRTAMQSVPCACLRRRGD